MVTKINPYITGFPQLTEFKQLFCFCTMFIFYSTGSWMLFSLFRKVNILLSNVICRNVISGLWARWKVPGQRAPRRKHVSLSIDWLRPLADRKRHYMRLVQKSDSTVIDDDLFYVVTFIQSTREICSNLWTVKYKVFHDHADVDDRNSIRSDLVKLICPACEERLPWFSGHFQLIFLQILVLLTLTSTKNFSPQQGMPVW